jgi:integrative and conjugative element protein (TIGR02256 family)
MELILTNKAYKSILDECLAAPETETGGILLGKKIDQHRLVVPFALGPGIKTIRSRFRFSPDIEWQQIYLEKLFNRYGANYIGSYHRHPGNNFLPSTHDFKAACQIVTGPDWNVQEAIFPIINLTGKRISFHPYYFTRRSKEFQFMDWRIVSHKDRLIKQVLKRGK